MPANVSASTKLLAGGTIIAFDEDTQLLRVVRDGSLLIEGDRIAAVWDTAQAPTAADGLPADNVEVIDCTGKILTPGFIDTHRHGWQTAFKTLASNTTLAEYYMRYSAYVAQPLFTPDDLYTSQLVGLYEALHAGVTTTLDHAHATWTREHAAAGWRAAVDSGARIFFAYALQNFPDFGIPDQIRHWRELHAPTATAHDGDLATLAIAYDSWTGDPQNPDTVAVRDLAL